MADFRQMRRFRQQLTDEEARAILKNGSEGVLALLGDGGYPYAVPLNYFFDGEKLIFHGATSGHKYDAIKNYEKASFCVISKKDIVPEKLTTYYKSVIVFGKIHILQGTDEARDECMKLGLHVLPNKEKVSTDIEENFKHLAVFVMEIEHITGKEYKPPVRE